MWNFKNYDSKQRQQLTRSYSSRRSQERLEPNQVRSNLSGSSVGSQGPSSYSDKPMQCLQSIARSFRKRRGSSSAPSVQIVDGKENCVVDAIAGVTGGDYGRAREMAAKHGFVPGEGINFRSARDAISDLGVNATHHYLQPDKWEDFPRRAIVAVDGDTSAHAVILEGEYIYDGNRERPVHRSEYQLRRNSSFIELREGIYPQFQYKDAMSRGTIKR